ncbi:MAG TPA: plasmid pRiA4b ORF-3 family protein [Terracidiphilus sp.]
MDEKPGPAAYRIHVWIRHINPMIWRRLLVPSESTLADLHYAIQIAFAWTDYHLHRFRIRGKEYGIPRLGGPWYSRNARDMRLIDFHFRVNERFLYEYDFTDSWEHQVRIEQFVPPEQRQPYSVCVGGGRAAPPEDCGGPAAFQQRRDATPWQACELVNQIAECVDKLDVTALRDRIDEIATMKEWLLLDKFDRREVNRRLRQYAAGDDEWRSQ